jgi:hypothetical protein
VEYTSFFLETDDSEFVGIVTRNLEQAAPDLHKMSPEEYVEKCREIWLECELDEVFAVKLIIDKLLLERTGNKGLPWEGMEAIHSEDDAIEEDIYCTALGLITPEGDFIGAPDGYESSPKNPRSKRGVAVAIPSDTLADETEDAQPEPYLLALLDCLGFEQRLSSIGLNQMRQLYDQLIQTALRPHAETNLWTPALSPVGPGLFSPGMFRLPMRYAYFSDSILLWTPYRPQFVGPFLVRCSNVVCEALRIGVPLRGSVTAGRLILHKRTNTFLGQELVEAARLEKAQDWLGVTLGASVRSEELRIPFDPRLVRFYHPPLKPGNEQLFSDLVLDWPRSWRDIHGVSARDAVEALRTPGFDKYYDNARGFIEESDNDPEWFLREALPRGT